MGTLTRKYGTNLLKKSEGLNKKVRKTYIAEEEEEEEEVSFVSFFFSLSFFLKECFQGNENIIECNMVLYTVFIF